MSLIYTGPADTWKEFDATANPILDDWTDLTGRTQVTPTIDADTGVYVMIGQSMIANYTDVKHTAGATVYNFNMFNGRTYNCADPMLGCGGPDGNVAGHIGDALVASGQHARVVMAPIACGGTSVGEWATGALGRRIDICLQRLREQGYTVTGVLYEQGQQDGTLGTSQAAWEASFAQIVTRVRVYTPAPIFVARSSFRHTATTYPTILAAQDAVVDNVDVFAGPDSDTLISASYRQQLPAAAHWKYLGAASSALLWRAAIEAVI